MAKHAIFVTVDDDMSDTSLQELADAVLMWKYVVSVEVIKNAAQQSVQTDDYWRCAKCQEYNPSNQGFCSGCGETRRR